MSKDDIIAPHFLLGMYAQGIFPMGMEDGEIGWFSPNPRGVIPLDEFHVPHGLRRTLKKGEYQTRVNQAFEEVINACADREETWINPLIQKTYITLHELGFAHSVEAWHEGELCGGLYGVSLGAAFFGESMFYRRTDASKIALVALVERLRKREFILLDTQWSTSHLATFGAKEISKEEYMHDLRLALSLERDFTRKFSKNIEKI